MISAVKLYLMRNSVGNYKIGVSTKPDVRARALQCASGLKVDVINIYSTELDAYVCENQAHRFYSEYRLYGEWFSFDETMIKSVDQMLKSICAGTTKKFERKPKLQYKEFNDKEFVNPCLQAVVKRFVSSPTYEDAKFLQKEMDEIIKRSLPLNAKECQAFSAISQFFKSAAHYSIIKADWHRAYRIAPKNGRIKLGSKDTDVITRLYLYLVREKD